MLLFVAIEGDDRVVIQVVFRLLNSDNTRLNKNGLDADRLERFGKDWLKRGTLLATQETLNGRHDILIAVQIANLEPVMLNLVGLEHCNLVQNEANLQVHVAEKRWLIRRQAY